VEIKTEVNESAFKHFFDLALLQRIAKAIHTPYPSFDKKKFTALMAQLKPLEMKARVKRIRDELHQQLPANFPKALKILLVSLNDETLQGFDLWPYTEFVQTYGLDHLELSLKALKQMTTLFTSEWAIRPFLKLYPDETLSYLEQCSHDKDIKVRRWASEGSRPRLPWGERLHNFIKDPTATSKILDNLKIDPELFVRKSVANHLNDIAKDHPEYVIKVLKKWQKTTEKEHLKKIDWIIRHSLRTLIKAGHPGALSLIGVSKDTKIKLQNFKINKKKIVLGDKIIFEFDIQSLSAKPQKLVVDYIIHFVKANKKNSPKVFKLKTIEILPKQTLTFIKSHHLKKVTTREYYSGRHVLEIQINGVVAEACNWTLEI
jgi:3-methyladenine DNA glycosylase AlkC